MTTPYLPTAGAANPTQYNGVYTAQVANAVDPLGQGRVTLIIPQVLGTAQSNYALPMQPGLTPSVGTNCLAVFLGGNVNVPYYFIGLSQDIIVAATSGGTVLNDNPFFIGNVIAPWTATNGTLTPIQPNVDTHPPYTYGALWQATGTGGGYISEVDSVFPTVVTQSYQIQAWVYYPLGGSINIGFGWTQPPATTVAAGSNGGEISNITAWGATYGGNGFLDVTSTAGYPPTGTLNVAASGSTTAVINYSGITETQFTGCAYLSGSATGTVATGGAITYGTTINPSTQAFTVPAGIWTALQTVQTALTPSGWAIIGPAVSSVGDQFTAEAVMVTGTISGGLITPGTITSTQIANGTIQLQDLNATSVTARAIGGITTTISAVAPANANQGDIWIDSYMGNQLNQFDGTNWNPLSFDANDVLQAGSVVTDLIAASAITAGQIAANSIYAGAIQAGAIDGTTINGITINGNTINAADIIISATDGGMFVYGSGGATIKTYNTAGSFTGGVGGTGWSCPVGVTSVKAECWGAGGGGGGHDTSAGTNGGGGGGGGGYSANAALTVSPGTIYAFTIGAGGAAGASNATGSTGATTWFDTSTTVTATGGVGGTTSGSGGAGGTATHGTGFTGGAGGSGADGGAGGNGNQTFNSSGTFTPGTGVTSISCHLYGGGGGGGTPYIGSNYSAGGGGGGGFTSGTLSCTPGVGITVTVGGGGSGGGAGQSYGSAGGTTTMSSLTAGGGGAGGYVANTSAAAGSGTTHNGGAGGENTNGTQSNPPVYGAGGGGCGGIGGAGGNGGAGTQSGQGASGAAGSSDAGAGGLGGLEGGTGAGGNVPGGGGGGGGNTSGTYGTGGAGAHGQIYVSWATAVQQGGGGGSAASSAQAGNAGSVENGGNLGASSGGDTSGSPILGAGGCGYDNAQAAQAGATGQIKLTYTASGATLIASFCGEAGTVDPINSISCPEGLCMYSQQEIYFVGTSGENMHGSINAPSADQLQINAPITNATDNQAQITMTSTLSSAPSAVINFNGAELDNFTTGSSSGFTTLSLGNSAGGGTNIWTHVNGASIGNISTTATCAATIPSGTGIAIGDLIFVSATCNTTTLGGSGGISCKDSHNGINFTALLLEAAQTSGSPYTYVQTFVYITPTAIPNSSTVTLTGFTGASASSIVVDIFRGGSGGADKAAVGTYTAAIQATGPAPALSGNATAGALVLSSIGTDNGSTFSNATYTMGSAVGTNGSGVPAGAIGYKLAATGSSTYSSTWNLATSHFSGTQTVSFLAGTASSVPTPASGITIYAQISGGVSRMFYINEAGTTYGPF